MAEPLALLVYEKVLPGTQLVNRLQDRGFRVRTVNALGEVVAVANENKPLLAIMDMGGRIEESCGAIAGLRENPATSHLPVIALVPAHDAAGSEAARRAGAKLVVSDSAILIHLDQLLDQALEVD